MNCVLKAVASGESPSLAEVFDLEQAKDFLLFCYYFFFIKTCTGAPFEWGPVISEWVQTFGKDQAERVFLAANSRWAEIAPTMWRIYCEGTDREKRMLVRIQREMHERGECEICKDHGTPTPEGGFAYSRCAGESYLR
jgi:hypothetical protein